VDGLAIVDMPGLDGRSSNWRDDPIHEWVIHRAEFFLFVQSSVAAFNGETDAFLRTVLERGTKPPIWAIQNIFDARHWQLEETRSKEAEAQRVQGAMRIAEILGEPPRSVLSLNLGLAWDAVETGNAEWKEAPAFQRFAAFKVNFSELLRHERWLIQERNCLKNIGMTLESSMRTINECEAEAVKFLQSNGAKRAVLQKQIESVDSFDYHPHLPFFEGEMGRIASDVRDHWRQEMQGEIDRALKELDRKMRGVEVNERIAALAAAVGRGGERFLRSSKAIAQLRESAAECCRRTEEKALREIDEHLEGLGFQILSKSRQPAVDTLPLIDSRTLPVESVAEGWWIWSKSYEGGEIRDLLKRRAKAWDTEILTRLRSWRDAAQAPFLEFCRQRKESYQVELRRFLKVFNETNERAEGLATRTQAIAEEFTQDLERLELLLDHAHASIKAPL